MPSLGADPDQLRAQAVRLVDAGDRLHELVTAVAGVVDGTTWHGPDADDFRSEVDRARLQAVITASWVRARGRVLDGEADQQDAASHPAAGGPDGIPAVNIFAGARASAHVPESSLADLVKHMDKARILFDSEYRLRQLPLSPAALRFLKAVPVVGAIPDIAQFGGALADGDTGAVIGNFYEIGLGLIPHPVAGGASWLNAALGDLALGGTSPAELSGEFAAADPRVKAAESVGAAISELIGFDEGSTESNVISSGSGLVAHLLFQHPSLVF